MKKKTQISLKKIAEATNLSITTVSRVLRKQGEISPQTRKKVMKVANELGYRPNLLIQGIQTGRTGNIGVMVPPYDAYWTEVLKGIHKGLVENDYAPIVLWDDSELSGRDPETFMLQQIHRLIDRRVDGVILWPQISEVYGTHLDELESRDLPVITIDHELDFADSVETDELAGAKLIAQHLYGLGHRRIGHLAGDPKWSWAQGRRTYFEKIINEFPNTICMTVVGGDDEHKIAEAARQLLSATPALTAIFACSDWVALEVYKVVSELGLKIPDDISIVGYSDTQTMSLLINPPLTTVRQKPRQIGIEAARILVNRINNKSKKDQRTRLKIDCELTVRKSTMKQ